MIKAIISPIFVNKESSFDGLQRRSKNYLIFDLAFRSFFKANIYGGLTGLAVPFAALPIISYEIKIYAATILAADIALECSRTFLKYHELSADPRYKLLYHRSIELLEWTMPFLLAKIWLTTGGNLIHEGGHAFAYLLTHTFKHGPHIFLGSVFNAATVYVGRYNWIECLLEPEKIKMVCTAAGPLATVISASAGIVLALKISKTYPQIARYLYVFSIASLFAEFTYALHNHLVSGDHGDYHKLWQHGIHPLVCVGFMVAVPLISSIAYLKLRERGKTCK